MLNVQHVEAPGTDKSSLLLRPSNNILVIGCHFLVASQLIQAHHIGKKQAGCNHMLTGIIIATYLIRY